MISYKACIVNNKDGTFDVLIDEKDDKCFEAAKLIKEGSVRYVSRMLSGHLDLKFAPEPEEVVVKPHLDGRTWFICSEDMVWWVQPDLTWRAFKVNEPCNAMQWNTKEEAEEVLKNMGY